MDTQELNQLWKTYQLKVTDEIAKSPEVLFCNGSAIGTLGKFFLRFATEALRDNSASTGKAKSKKTIHFYQTNSDLFTQINVNIANLLSETIYLVLSKDGS